MKPRPFFSPRRCVALAWLAAFALAALFASSAEAGSRPVEMLILRVDDGSDAASRACYGRIRRRAAREDTTLRSVPREVALRRIDEPSFDGFAAWPRERFAGLDPSRHGDLDAVVLVDCRPSRGTLDLVMFAGTDGHAVTDGHDQRVQLREAELDNTRIDWVASQLALWMWTGFSP